MNTFEGRGGYEYEILPDGGFKIIKSPKSAGGQVIAKGDKYWDLIKKEQDELAGFVDRQDHKQNAGRESSARSGLADARSSAASAAAKVDTSPMAMAMEKAKSSPGGATPGTNKVSGTKPQVPQVPQDKIDSMSREAGQFDSKKPSLTEVASIRPLSNARTEELVSSGAIEKKASDNWHKAEGEKQMDRLYPAGQRVEGAGDEEEPKQVASRSASRSNINR